MAADKRERAERRSLIDTVQFFEEETKSSAKARTSDLSLSGCYIETMNPPPLGSKIRVRLTLRGNRFEAQAVVVRCEPPMGMALQFTHIEPADRAVLEKWLAESA